MYDFKRRYPLDKLEAVGVDTRDGSALASLYDIVSYPGIVVLREDGTPSMIWQGEALPLIDEVAGYALN